MQSDPSLAPYAAPARHMPAAISFNWMHIKRDINAVDGFNAKFAILLTRAGGTMWAFWVFNGIALGLICTPQPLHGTIDRSAGATEPEAPVQHPPGILRAGRRAGGGAVQHDTDQCPAVPDRLE
jgi:hypothetical protein